MLKRVTFAEDPQTGSVHADPGSSASSLAGRVWRLVRKADLPLVLTVVVPTAIATLYFGLFSSDVYLSESRFIVRSPERAPTTGIGALLRTAGWSNAGTEVYVARDYVLSRDALNFLNRDGSVAEAFSNPKISIFDRFNPLGWSGSMESLYKYYLDKVAVNYDATSTVTTLQVRAFSAKDAYRFNSLLMQRAEDLVNRLSMRAQDDLVRLARSEVDGAKAQVAETAIALAAFRNRNKIVDPENQASIELQMIAKLQDELISTRMQLTQLRRLTPDNPQIETLESTAASLQREIDAHTAKVVGGADSMAGIAARYQRLVLDNQFAEKRLTAAMSAYEEARSDALRKQAYVERIVEPSLPDKAQEPRRIRGIITTFIMGLVSWGVLSMLLAGVKEHRD